MIVNFVVDSFIFQSCKWLENIIFQSIRLSVMANDDEDDRNMPSPKKDKRIQQQLQSDCSYTRDTIVLKKFIQFYRNILIFFQIFESWKHSKFLKDFLEKNDQKTDGRESKSKKVCLGGMVGDFLRTMVSRVQGQCGNKLKKMPKSNKEIAKSFRTVSITKIN